MILSWIGLILGIGGILLGQALEGGHMSSIIQATAGIIVLAGTLGATLLASTMSEFSGAIRGLSKVFFKGGHDFNPLIKEIISMASAARKEGILALERHVGDIKHPFFQSNLRHVVDGYDPAVLNQMMDDRISKDEEEKNAIAKVWETAGGFAPTVGILGAVLGLIHVMENLADSTKLGSGIAVAFVATVYGVGAANLILIPVGTKLKKIGKEEVLELELIKVGILSIQSGLNPRIIEDRLHNLLGEGSHENEGGGGREGSPQEKKAA